MNGLNQLPSENRYVIRAIKRILLRMDQEVLGEK